MMKKDLTKNTISIFSRLLAEENIEVKHDPRATTASFDTKFRVMTLPTYGDSISSIAQISLALHETGHATDTDMNDYVTAAKKYGKAVANILEDVRIEKLVKRKFPGAKAAFSAGYAELVEDHNFFGTAHNEDIYDFSHFGFLDRVNVHFKLGPRAFVPFSASERMLVDEIAEIETHEDLLRLAAKLKEIAEENEKKEEPQPEEFGLEDSDEDSDEGESDDTPADEDSEEFDEDGGSDEESDEESDEDGDITFTDEYSDEEPEESDEDGNSGGASDESGEESDEESDSAEGGEESDEEFDPSEIDLSSEDLDDSESQNAADNALEHLASNDDNIAYLPETDKIPEGRFNDYTSFLSAAKNFDIAAYANTMKSFRTENKTIINKMVAEFNRNAEGFARRNVRNRATGTLNPNKMIHYRYNDNIFKKKTYNLKGKNHGIIIMLDGSGSMRWGAGQARRHVTVLKQALLAAELAKKINVPFKVITWTNRFMFGGRHVNHVVTRDNSWVQAGHACLTELLSSDMSNAEYELAANVICAAPDWIYTASGQTPLSSSLQHLMPVLKKFKKGNSLDVVNVQFLTDGEGQDSLFTSPYGKKIVVDSETGEQHTREKIMKIFKHQDSLVPEHAYSRPRHTTEEEMFFWSKVYRSRFGANISFMRINKLGRPNGVSSEWRQSLSGKLRCGIIDGETADKYRKELLKNDIVTLPPIEGMAITLINDAYAMSNADDIELTGLEGVKLKNAFKKQAAKTAASRIFAETMSRQIAQR